MDEHILFHNAGIRISSQQLIVPGHIYSLKDIESVEFTQLEPKRTLAIVLLLAGLFLLFREGNLFALGGFSVLMGIVIWINGNTQYSVIINTLTGRHEVLSSMDRAYIEKILQALDAAMLKNAHPRPAAGHANPLQALDDNTGDISINRS